MLGFLRDIFPVFAIVILPFVPVLIAAAYGTGRRRAGRKAAEKRP